MKTVSSWKDVEPFGIIALTGEACGLMYRLLFDATDDGRKILEKCFGCGLMLADPWNTGPKDRPHIGSIMLSHEMLVPVAIFALLENGCVEVWRSNDVLFGIENTDSQDHLEALQRQHGLMRRFAYRGTAGDRNIHVTTNRVL